MPGRGLRIFACLVAIGTVLATASVAEAAKPKLFGIAATNYPTAAEMQRLATGGVSTLRAQVYWGAIEPTPGQRRWDVLDPLVAETARQGISFLPLLFGTPSWLSSNAAAPPIYTDQARAAWAAFVTDLALRYGSNGTFWALHPELPRAPLVEYQVWNEVNLNFFWGGRPNARRYADLLRLTRNSLRAGDPAAKVITAGLLPFRSTGAGSVASEPYLRRLYRVKGVRKLFDAVAIHPYGSSPKKVLKALDRSREVLDSLHARRTPIWATEFGWTTGGAGFQSSPFRSSLGQQASRVAKSFKLLKGNRKRLKLRAALYFTLRDTDPPGVDEWISRMGLFDLGGSPKPAWFAFARRAGGTP